MRFPVHVTTGTARHQIANALRGRKRYPFVLMLEPLYACNLACLGCAVERHTGKLKDRLTLDACLGAVEDAGAPIVSVCGGEPTLYPELADLIGGLISRRKHTYLCTNGLLLDQKVYGHIPPHKRLTLNVHLDGMRTTHDYVCDREGVFDKAVSAIRLLVARGFRVTTNTTFFAGETPGSAARLFDFLASLGVEAMTVAAAFGYERAADRDHFLGRAGTRDLFREIFGIGRARGWRFNHSGLYLDFLAGGREYRCSPWANPTRNIFGWQKPCYLLDDGYAGSYEELLASTDWEKYGAGRDPRCADCMVHCGYEPSAALGYGKKSGDTLKYLKWQLRL